MHVSPAVLLGAALLVGVGVGPWLARTSARLATRRAGRRTALPFGPPLLVGAVLALALAGPAAVG